MIINESHSRAGDEPGIGIIGAGLIVQNAHLPGYRTSGRRVVAITDIDTALAARVAEKWGLRHIETAEKLIGDSDVDIVDLAITPAAQPDIARLAFAHRKHVLAQKPLALDLDTAANLADEAEAAGVLLAVNQQMRWSPAIRAMRNAFDDGFVGDPVTLHYHVDIAGEYAPEHWLSVQPRFMATFGTIHYLDSGRSLLGDPVRVTARLLWHPRQVSAGETFINVWVEFSSGANLVGFERYHNMSGYTPSSIQLDGTTGSVRAHLGIYDDYPKPTPDVVERASYSAPGWHDISDGSTWLPDAFAGPMGGLVEAVRGGPKPPTNARDNLKTLRLVDAVYRSHAEGRTIDLTQDRS